MKKLLSLSAVCCAGMIAWGFTEENLNTFAVTDASGALIVLGTEGSYGNAANLTKAAAFDGDTSTFFDPPAASANAGGSWCGLEMQTAKVCTKIRYRGRSTMGFRMRGALIQGANQADFSDAETIHVVNPSSSWNGSSYATENCSRPAAMRAWKYFRLITPTPYSNANQTGVAAGNVSELEFWGNDATAAADVPAPSAASVTFAATINGQMNICFAGTEDVWVYEVQRKIAYETDWSDWGTVSGRDVADRWIHGVGVVGWDAAYRVRTHSLGGSTDWSSVIPIAPTYPLTGTWIGTPGSWATNASCVGSVAFDGSVTSFYDALYPDGNWTGLDFGRVRTVNGVRYAPRSTNRDRMNGGHFEIANEADFSDATVVHTVSGTPAFAVTEVMFETPVSGRYARYVAKDGSKAYGNIAECEFVGPRELPTPTALAVTRSDITNQIPILTWTASASDGMSSTIVWQATAPGGPWTNRVAALPVTTTIWTNDAARVGVKYWYRLSYATGSDETLFVGEPGEERAAFRRGIRIDRDWSDNTKLRDGFTPFEYVKAWNNAGNGATKLFDGSVSTYADIVEADNKSDFGGLMAGLDLGEEYGLLFARGYPRDGQGGRAGGHYVYGSNETDSTDTNNWSRTLLSAKFSFSSTAWRLVEGTTSATFRKMFINRPDGNGFCNFAELEFYGWRVADVADVLQGPEELTATPTEEGVLLAWVGCAAATDYRIEYQLNDSGSWSTLATVTEPSYLHTDAIPYDGRYFTYRVVALKDEEVGYSDSVRLAPYLPGTGTGLTGVYTWPWARDTYEPVQATMTNHASVINFDWWTNKLMSAVVGSSNNVHVTWTGRLIVPFDGDYTFTTSVDDYFVLRIDDRYVVNARGTFSSKTNVTVSLTKGEHPIRIDYAELTGNAYCRLYWGGCLNEELIPASQLIPEDPPDESPWEGNRSFGSTVQGAADLDGDVIRLGATGGDLTGSSNRYHFRWQTVRGNFDSRMHVKVIDKANRMKALLMARSSLDPKAPYVAPALMWMSEHSAYAYGVKRRMTQGANTLDAEPAWTNGGLGDEGELRLVRMGDTFTCYARAKGASTWTLIDKYTFEPGIFGSEVQIGVASCLEAYRAEPYYQEVTGFTVQKWSGGTMLIIR